MSAARADFRPRVAGALLLVHLAGLIVPFVLLLPLSGGPERWLTGAAGDAVQVRIAVGLLFLTCTLTVAISLVLFPAIRAWNEAMALALVAAGGIVFALQAADNAHLLAMVSLSARAALPGAEGPWDQAAAALGAVRRGTHLAWLVAIDGWMLLLFLSLHRARLAPRAVTWFGLATVALHFGAIPLRALAGYPMLGTLGMPMAASQLALAGWWLGRGDGTGRRPG